MNHIDDLYAQRAKKVMLALKGELSANKCQKKISPFANCQCLECSSNKRLVPTGHINPEVTNSRIIGMVMNRLKVIQGITKKILESVEEANQLAEEQGKTLQMEPWMIDKITLAADYLSAVEDNATHGDGLELISQPDKSY